MIAAFRQPRAGGHSVRRWLRTGGHASDRNTDQTVKIKLDENLPDRLVSVLTGLAHDVDTVRGEQLTGRTDPAVWSAAPSVS